MEATLDDDGGGRARGRSRRRSRAVGIGAAGLVETDDRRADVRPEPRLAQRAARPAPRVASSACRRSPTTTTRRGVGRVPASAPAAASRHLLFVGVGHRDRRRHRRPTGRLFRGAHGFAAEIGHIVVDPDGPLCGCGNRGCWEQLASRPGAITRAGREAAAQHPHSMHRATLRRRPVAGDGPDRDRGGARRRPGRPSRSSRRSAGASARGSAGLVNVLDPEIVVVGGRRRRRRATSLLEPARASFATRSRPPTHRPDVPLVTAALGNDAGVVGAASLVLETPA